MKLKTTLLASLFAAIAAFSVGAQAASDMDKAPEAKAPATSMQAEKSTPAKKHSHVEEKTGVPQSMPATMENQPDPSKDKNRHLHPRDGK